MYACEFCGTQYRYRFSAAICCDVVSNTVDVDPELNVTLGYD